MESPIRRDLIPEGIEIIETFLRTADGVMPRLERHVGRMCLAAGRLNFSYSASEAREMAAQISSNVALRCRFALTRKGLSLTTSPATVAVASWKVMMSKDAIDEKDIWRGLKTSQRAIYDQARADMPSGIDEVLFLNTRGAVAEGAITNIFVKDDKGMLLTPPVSAGALPGVLRADLLAADQAKVARLSLRDLTESKIFCGNSLRGLIPAELVL